MLPDPMQYLQKRVLIVSTKQKIEGRVNSITRSGIDVTFHLQVARDVTVTKTPRLLGEVNIQWEDSYAISFVR